MQSFRSSCVTPQFTCWSSAASKSRPAIEFSSVREGVDIFCFLCKFLFMKQKFPTIQNGDSQHKSAGAVIHVGESLRRARTRMGLRVADLASRAGFTKGFVSKIENGKSSPP